jgi:hypothetical protein
LAAGAVLLVMLMTEARSQKRVALVIGNSAYQNTPALANPINDAEDIAAALKRLGFTVIHEQDLSKRGMEGAIARFARLAQDADAALFFYAGHGMQYRNLNYLMPVDAKLEDEFSVNFELTRLSDVLFGLEQARGTKIVILDACRNNPLGERLSRNATTRDLISGRGLARVEATRGMLVAFSTQVNQVALDGDARNSPFARALARHIDEPGLEIGALFRRVAAEVDRETHGHQLPELSISLLGEFYLNPRETDLQAWAKVRNTSDPEIFKEFVRRYPTSLLVPDARQRIEMIERNLHDRRLRDDAERAERELQFRIRAEQDRREQALREKAEPEQREQFAREQEVQARLAAEQAAREQAEREGFEREQTTKAEAERKALAAERDKEKVPASASVQIALLTPPPVDQPPVSGEVLVRRIKTELKRVGCYAGAIDGIWTNRQTKSSIVRFAKLAKLAAIPNEPTVDFLDTLRARSAPVCPLLCSAREVEQDGRCVPAGKVKPASPPAKPAKTDSPTEARTGTLSSTACSQRHANCLAGCSNTTMRYPAQCTMLCADNYMACQRTGR